MSNSHDTKTERDCSVWVVYELSQLCEVFPLQGNHTSKTQLIKPYEPYCNWARVANYNLNVLNCIVGN